jgi:tripartite-type tricarboxylate transporter receptor subunit TctC
MIESGFASVVASNWNGIVAPGGVSKEIISRLNQEIGRALSARDVNERFATLGFSSLSGSAEDFAAFLRADAAKWEKVIKAAGIAPL